MRKPFKEISFFCPAYLDEANLSQVVYAMERKLNKLFERFEIIIVEDCSPDSTALVADLLALKFKNVKTIHHQKRMGVGGTLKSGFKAAKYEMVGYVDGDNQYNFVELENLLNKIEFADVISGFRINRADRLRRKIQSKIYNKVLKILYNLNLKDANCGFKIYKKEVVEAILPIQSKSGFVDAEMLIKSKDKGFKITEVPVSHLPRLHGRASGGSLSLIFETVSEMLSPNFKKYRRKNLYSKTLFSILKLVQKTLSLVSQGKAGFQFKNG